MKNIIILLSCVIILIFQSCYKKSNMIETNTINIYNDTNKNIISSWYVFEINGKFQNTTLRGSILNPDIKIYDTIKAGIRYDVFDQNIFYDNRYNYGYWIKKDNMIITNIILPLYKKDKIVSYEEINRTYSIELINNNCAIFQYEDMFTGNKIVERAIKWNSELFNIIKNGDMNEICNYFEQENNSYLISNRYENGVTVLMYALELNNTDAALYLIENGVDVNAINIFNMSALHYACKTEKAGQSLDIIRLLIEKGIDINLTDILGQTPLDYTLYEPKKIDEGVLEAQIILEKNGGKYSTSLREQFARSVRKLEN